MAVEGILRGRLTFNALGTQAGSYVIGEFGFMLNGSDEGDAPGITGVQQFAVLHQHFPRVSSATKCILLSTYVKMQYLYPELKEKVRLPRHFVLCCER